MPMMGVAVVRRFFGLFDKEATAVEGIRGDEKPPVMPKQVMMILTEYL